MNDARTDSQAHREYSESRILLAHPVEIVNMLYQVAIENLNVAIACFKTGDNFRRSKAVSKAQSAVHELMAALDPAASESLCRNLAELYDYALREISVGHTRRSEQAFENALGVLTTLSEGWSGVRATVMGDNQAVEAEAHSAPERQPEATPEPGISRLYSEPSPLPAGTARDWSC